jgi:polyhydroxybutyrate depolymerase
MAARKLIAALAALTTVAAAAAAQEVPGRWGTTDTSQVKDMVWPDTWVGARNLRAQWFKILAESPEAWRASGYIHHAKGEPPDNTYYLWRYDKPLPAGTRILIEGDFPHARLMSFQVCAPWNARQLVTADGVGLPEIHILDEDIVPDPGHVNPYLPGADRNARKRHFHLAFELRDGDAVALNPQAALPPYRAPGNLRIGCTGTAAPGSLAGAGKTHGPVVYMRMYLPDRHEPYGGVEPPVIRIQLPGQVPELAPISRGMPINRRKFIDGYALADNPARADGLSVKEAEANAELEAYARNAVAKGGTPGYDVPSVHRLLDDPDGSLRLYKNFQTPYLITYFKDYATDAEGCRSKLPKRYLRAFGAMGPPGPGVVPPGDDEHVSDHHIYNTYLVSAANLRPGQFLVFRGKAPKTPRTLNGNPTMEASDQLRYWNITLQAGQPTRLTPVINIGDEDVVLNARGEYTIVIGREQDRPPAATARNGITWRDWPAGAVLSVSIRVTSTAANPWLHAPQRITWQDADTCTPGRNPQAVRERMGEYAFAGRYLDRAEVDKLIAGAPPVGASATVKVDAPAGGGSDNRRLGFGGKDRSYLIHRPAKLADQHPAVIIALHGGQSSGHAMEELTGLSALADREGFLAVYPEATGRYRDKLYWNDGRVPEVDDVGFIGAVIDDLVVRDGADPKRIYLTGISNGASMTNRVAIELAERIAAIAPVAGTIAVRSAAQASPGRPVPVMYIHGDADPLAYFDGGSAGTRRGSALSADAYVDWWAKHNGCTSSADAVALPTRITDGTEVLRSTRGACRNDAGVVFYRIRGGGHTWPGGAPWFAEQLVGKTSGNLDASAEMWAFFSRHRLP